MIILKRFWTRFHLRLMMRSSFFTFVSLLLRLGRRECFFLGFFAMAFFLFMALSLFVLFIFMSESPWN